MYSESYKNHFYFYQTGKEVNTLKTQQTGTLQKEDAKAIFSLRIRATYWPCLFRLYCLHALMITDTQLNAFAQHTVVTWHLDLDPSSASRYVCGTGQVT